jgi:hypothetical protein
LSKSFLAAVESQGGRQFLPSLAPLCFGGLFLYDRSQAIGRASIAAGGELARPAFRHELMAFPNGRHDDQVDSVAQFLDWMSLRV